MCPFINCFFFLLTVNCSPIDLSQLLFPAIQKPLILELSSYSQKILRLCFIFPCYQNKHTANLSHRRGPILTCLSGGLLIFHNWFACFHPVLGDKYLQLSHRSNIYEKHTCHWKNTGRVSRSVITADWCKDFYSVFVKEVTVWLLCHVGKLFPPALGW